ncbi:MAG: hypothetical protein ABGY41_09390 [Candidatus Poribacteria bacterium]
MTITLTDEQAEFVRRRVECGKNASEQEVLDQALDALHADELEEEVGHDVVKAAIEEGARSSDVVRASGCMARKTCAGSL